MARIVDGKKYIPWSNPMSRSKAIVLAASFRKSRVGNSARVFPSEHYKNPADNKGLYQVYITTEPMKR